MAKITSLIFVVSLFCISATAAAPQKPLVVVLYTATGLESGEDVEDLTQVTQFAFDQYDLENHTKSDFKVVGVDDRDDPVHALQELKNISNQQKPLAIIGPVYSNVAMGLKDYINQIKVPLMSVFATHNDLTKGSDYIFRICASNRRLVKAMADYLIPEVQKHHLNIITFKDLSDDYSVDLADTFRLNISGIKMGYNEVLFRGVGGIERIQDLNSKIWTPTKSDIIFLPTRDAIAGHVIAALESEPYMVASIDPISFLKITKKIKKDKTHIKLVSTSQWLPEKSEYSKTIEEAFRKRFGRGMTITTALAYDAAYTIVAAYHRSQSKNELLVKALRDSTRLKGITGTIFLGHDGERVFSDQFLKEDYIE
jgi:ABC-type branched-subunit amino acid transport system substrate-binding protein